ncbi:MULTISPECIES: tyrosine-type recombinase/integrase [unclassified Paenibacillus]
MDDDDYLFPSRQRKTLTEAVGEPIHRITAYKMISGIANRFGLTDIGVHSLRKTWGYHLYNDDPRNLALLMEMFGHEDMATTLKYLGITQECYTPFEFYTIRLMLHSNVRMGQSLI